MFKNLLTGLIMIGLGLYFLGVLIFNDNAESIDISIDKKKVEELGLSITDELKHSALSFTDNEKSINISIDKKKIEELGKNIKEELNP
ncbi:hypothetical protein JHD50_10435 [Sulfurimonas sp. MAG313]|nr:hypothetical protein [Sulfurimonas sp. MAG313]MDF1881710.1 hypothetical protein [Sulfurimonas sp. MAG313]